MTVNKNVRCVEWHETWIVTPTDARFVIGWYPPGVPAVVRLNGDRWVFEHDGPGMPREPKPSHWCEFPDGPEVEDYFREVQSYEEHGPKAQDFL